MLRVCRWCQLPILYLHGSIGLVLLYYEYMGYERFSFRSLYSVGMGLVAFLQMTIGDSHVTGCVAAEKNGIKAVAWLDEVWFQMRPQHVCYVK